MKPSLGLSGLPIVGAVILSLAGCGEPPAAPPAGPVKVKALTVAAKDVPYTATYVGRTVANRTINVVARVTGFMLERPYREGDPVAAGAVLFKIDPKEFEADLETSRAKIAQAEAQVARAEADFRRIEPLAKAGAAPVAELDTATTNLQAAKADLRAAKAQVVNAELNLGYTTIAAPFPGLAGKASADPGALIGPASGTLCLLDQVDPIAVEFTVSEQDLLNLRADIAAGRLRAPDPDKLEVKAVLLDGGDYPEGGKLSFRDVRIKPETGTALMRALFPNPKGLLRAGQFVRVVLSGATRVAAILVPQQAVLQSPTGSSVLVVKEDHTIEARTVKVGDWEEGRQWLVGSGLKPGEVIVVEGLQKARPGAKVEAEMTAAGADKPAEKPAEPPGDAAKPPATPKP